MTTLGKILGGISKDITQSQISSDLTAMEYLQQYQSHDLLKHIESPRVSIKNINLKMQFVIEDISEMEESEEIRETVDRNWNNYVTSRLLPRLLDETMSNPNSVDLAKQNIFRYAKLGSQPAYDSINAINGQTTEHLKTTSTYVKNLIGQLPDDLKESLPDSDTLSTKIDQIVDESFTESRLQLKKLAASKAASELNLNILVDKQSLNEAEKEEIHEIEITLELDFMQPELNNQQ